MKSTALWMLGINRITILWRWTSVTKVMSRSTGEYRGGEGQRWPCTVHPPQFDLAIISPWDDERQGRVEGRPVDSTVMSLQDVLHDGVRRPEQIGLPGLQVLIHSPWPGWGALLPQTLTQIEQTISNSGAYNAHSLHLTRNCTSKLAVSVACPSPTTTHYNTERPDQYLTLFHLPRRMLAYK